MADAAPSSSRKYFVLFAFCANSFLQNFMFMDYSGAYDLSQDLLNIDSTFATNVLYSGAFVATLPAMVLSGWMLLNGYDRSALLGMTALIVIAGWLRWLSISQAA